jgi:hypothetical protein
VLLSTPRLKTSASYSSFNMAYSLSWLKREKEELLRDRTAFATALDTIKKRVLESNELEIPRQPLLHEWSGTRAVVGSLEMALNAVERTLDEMDNLIYAIESGAVKDADEGSRN